MPTDEEQAEQPEQAEDSEEMEIELHGPPEPAAEPDQEVLEITAEELAEPPPGTDLPALSGLDALVADGLANWVDIPAVCGKTGGSFAVRFREAKPGHYEYVGAEARSGQADRAQAVGGYRDVKAEFGLADYPGCPLCGSPGLAVCSECQTVSCGATARETERGLVITCPHCHQDGELIPGGPGTQVRADGDTGKKKW